MLEADAAPRIIDRAVQIRGGEAVRRGSVVERLYRDVRALRIDPRTTETQRLTHSRYLIGK